MDMLQIAFLSDIGLSSVVNTRESSAAYPELKARAGGVCSAYQSGGAGPRLSPSDRHETVLLSGNRKLRTQIEAVRPLKGDRRLVMNGQSLVGCEKRSLYPAGFTHRAAARVHEQCQALPADCSDNHLRA